ncbi:hypothetical protein ACFE04_026752 [Oxalis oulophora]
MLHFLIFIFLSHFLTFSSPTPTELTLLLQIKSSLDPNNTLLTSWTPNTDPCSTHSFDGVACDETGHVANISLQGRGLSGQIPAAVGGLKSLTGLYLHFNALTGDIPMEISQLSLLTDLYLNVNDLSGLIPHQISNLTNLQVLQLCYNNLSGSVPTQLGSLQKLSVLALQYNQLTGTIPASLGDLPLLTRLDLSFNHLFGPVPLKVADAPMLQVLDIRNNTLSGVVPSALKRLNEGFQYENNPGLCGTGFSKLSACSDSNQPNVSRPEPFKPNGNNQKDIPESADLSKNNCSNNDCSRRSPNSQNGLIFGAIGVFIVLAFISLFAFSWYRRRKQKIGNSFDASDGRLSTDQPKEVIRKSGSPLISLEYSNGWDPVGKGRNTNGFSQEVLETFMFNLEEVERATQCFSEANLLGKSSSSTVYKGILRDGSVVAIKRIPKTSCKTDEAEFLKGLKILTSLKHENLVRLKGFCCSKGRGECFLIYDYVPNGNLLQYLDVTENNEHILEWSTRISIINSIAKGLAYLHGNKGTKIALVHQNISAEKIFIDYWYNPVLSDSGLHKLLADDIVFSMLKASAAMGYLAPEYTTTGRFTEKSDIYAFGVIILQIITGKRKISQSIRQPIETFQVQDFIDQNLEGKYSQGDATPLLNSVWNLASVFHRQVKSPSMVNATDKRAAGRGC